MTSCCRLTSARSLPAPVYYDMNEKLSVGTALGRGLIIDAKLATIYSETELDRLHFSLVRGLPPDLASQYFTIDQSNRRLEVDND